MKYEIGVTLQVVVKNLGVFVMVITLHCLANTLLKKRLSKLLNVFGMMLRRNIYGKIEQIKNEINILGNHDTRRN